MADRIITHLMLLADIYELAQILREEQIERPVQCHANLFFEPRQFAQIDGAPHPPGEKSRYIYAEDACYASPMSNGGELADGFEVELFERAAIEVGLNVLRND